MCKNLTEEEMQTKKNDLEIAPGINVCLKSSKYAMTYPMEYSLLPNWEGDISVIRNKKESNRGFLHLPYYHTNKITNFSRSL